jgi:hypothetical protein
MYWPVLLFIFSLAGPLSNSFQIARHNVRLPLVRSVVTRLESKPSTSEIDPSAVRETLKACVLDRSVGSEALVQLLESLERRSIDFERISQGYVNGTFELIFSSAVAQLPIVGNMLDGYLPNKETIVFDFDAGVMSLTVETLPFLPKIDIIGEGLDWDTQATTLSYIIQGKDKKSQWKILYADESIVAGKSSVTGLNVIRRLS